MAAHLPVSGGTIIDYNRRLIETSCNQALDCALLTIDQKKKKKNASLVIWHTIHSEMAKPKRAHESSAAYLLLLLLLP